MSIGVTVERNTTCRCVLETGRVGKKRLTTAGCVAGTGCVFKERAPAARCVGIAGGISNQCLKTDRRVLIGSVVLECLSSNGCVLSSCREAKESFRTDCGVVGAGSQGEECSGSALSRISAKIKPSGVGLTLAL